MRKCIICVALFLAACCGSRVRLPTFDAGTNLLADGVIASPASRELRPIKIGDDAEMLISLARQHPGFTFREVHAKGGYRFFCFESSRTFLPGDSGNVLNSIVVDTTRGGYFIFSLAKS